MFFRATKEPDVEDNPGGHAGQNMLDFADPSWIIDHHRHNLIKKISRSDSSWFEVLTQPWRRRPARKFEPHTNNNHDQQKPSKGHYQGNAAENSKLGPSNQQHSDVSNHGRFEAREGSYEINLCELQRLYLRQLQQKLVKHAVDLRYDALEPSGWADDLRQYGKAGITHH